MTAEQGGPPAPGQPSRHPGRAPARTANHTRASTRRLRAPGADMSEVYLRLEPGPGSAAHPDRDLRGLLRRRGGGRGRQPVAPVAPDQQDGLGHDQQQREEGEPARQRPGRLRRQRTSRWRAARSGRRNSVSRARAWYHSPDELPELRERDGGPYTRRPSWPERGYRHVRRMPGILVRSQRKRSTVASIDAQAVYADRRGIIR